MFKRLEFHLPEKAGRILIIHDCPEAESLLLRVEHAIKDLEGWEVALSKYLHPDFDYVYCTIPLPEDAIKGYKSCFCTTPFEEAGYTPSQKDLINTDWQALRNIERELLKMHEAGLWTLPDETRQLMTDREACRDKVDEEINPYDSPS